VRWNASGGTAIRLYASGKVWNQIARSDDPNIRSMFLRQVHHCPAGRLVAFDKAAGKTIEQDLPVSIGLIEDPVKDCSGPIWLRGGISLQSADSYHYEIRNRVTFADVAHRRTSRSAMEAMHRLNSKQKRPSTNRRWLNAPADLTWCSIWLGRGQARKTCPKHEIVTLHEREEVKEQFHS